MAGLVPLPKFPKLTKITARTGKTISPKAGMLCTIITGALAFQGSSIAARSKTARSAIRADDGFAYGLAGVTGPVSTRTPVVLCVVHEADARALFCA